MGPGKVPGLPNTTRSAPLRRAGTLPAYYLSPAYCREDFPAYLTLLVPPLSVGRSRSRGIPAYSLSPDYCREEFPAYITLLVPSVFVGRSRSRGIPAYSPWNQSTQSGRSQNEPLCSTFFSM